VRSVHNAQQDKTMEDMCISVPKIYANLDNKKCEFQSHMIKVEGNINKHPIDILIDSGTSHSYLDPKMVERFHLPRNKLGKPWMVQLAIGAKRNINEMVKACSMSMNGLNTSANLNIIPLHSYVFLIGIYWLDQHHVVMDYYNKEFTCLDEEGNLRTVQGIPRSLTIKEFLALQLKKSYRKGCQIFVMQMEETPKDKVPNIEDCAILKDFEDVLK
jgi:hypothetical protein